MKLDEERIKLDQSADKLAKEAKALKAQKDDQTEEKQLLDEESEWLAKKRADHVNSTLKLEEEADLIKKKKALIDEDKTKLAQEEARLRSRRDAYQEDVKALAEEEKWLDEKRNKHIEDAKQLDEERKWLQEKRKQLEEQLAEKEEDEEQGDPASAEAFEKCVELVKQGNFKSVSEIIQHFPEIINFVDEDDHNTLLHWAAVSNNMPIAKFLIDKGAEFYANKAGKTPQQLAAENKGKGEAMKRFLEQKAKKS